MNKKKCNRNTC